MPIVTIVGLVVIAVLLGLVAALLKRSPESSGALRPSRPVTIPVSVDAVRDVSGHDAVRMTYYVVSSDTPTPGWIVGLGREIGLPLRVLGQVGIVYRPRSSERFETPEDIERLFASVESNPNLSIETEDVWVPLDWLPRECEPARGDVYRIEIGDFQRAFRYRDEQLTPDTLFSGTAAHVGFSEGETTVFRTWAQRQIDVAREAYPKNEKRALTWREESS